VLVKKGVNNKVEKGFRRGKNFWGKSEKLEVTHRKKSSGGDLRTGKGSKKATIKKSPGGTQTRRGGAGIQSPI